MRGVEVVVGILVTWRVTHLVVAEDGPWNIVARLRGAAGNGFWGQLMDCFYCSSVWMALPVALGIGEEWRARLLLWPAFSGGAILLERLSARGAEPTPDGG